MKGKRKENIGKPRKLTATQTKNLLFLTMVLPGVIWFILLRYMPMAGIVLAFKDYKVYPKNPTFWNNLTHSEWVGLSNFKFLFQTKDVWLIIRNTLGYNLLWIVLGLVLSVALAIILNEITHKFAAKTYQTLMFFPYFLSWVVASYFVLAFLDPTRGLLTHWQMNHGIEPTSWYSAPKYWPYILTICNVWKNTGYSCILYLAAITGLMHHSMRRRQLTEQQNGSKLNILRFHTFGRCVTFSCLYPFSTAYYRKFGYEIGASCSTYEWKLSFIPKWKIGGHCVLVDASNRQAVLSDIKMLYQSWQERYNFMIMNEAWEYHFITEANPYEKLEFTYLYYMDDGTPAGYLTFHKEKKEKGQLLVCTKLVFVRAAGFKGLFTLIKSFASDFYAIQFKLPDDCEIEPLMEEISFHACVKTRAHLGMVRVINVQKVLEMAQYIGSGKIVLEIWDEYISQNDGIFEVEFKDGRAVFVKKAREKTVPQVAMPVNEFSRLITGVLRTEDIAFCENIRLSENTPEMQKLLRQIFYKKSCYLMEYF